MKLSRLFIIAVLPVAGCAWMNYFNPADVHQGVWEHIRASGISRDASHAVLADKVTVEGQTNHFTSKDEKVTYWAHFTFSAFYSPEDVMFQARWYDPDGNLFYEDAFPLNNGFDSMFMKTHLPIKDSPAQYFPGVWQVEIYYKGYSIDKKPFHILPEDPGTYRPAPAAQTTSETVSQLWDVVKERRTGYEDRAFLDQFERARQLIQENKLGEAKLLFDEILRTEPHLTEAHLGLAAVYYRMKSWQNALKELEYVVQNPDYRDQATALREHIREITNQKNGK